ncbi:probable methyltransferase pmt28 [Phtheirospermum japonicum]|uniref:Methyltransferase n=1 Tax=Phtheirospermum japonicum TaxID=374723 RepID=A0A830CGR1_9LAMI|nr:probable methyltransferase pmt28 [Phtheirospermum japonicum]
MAIARFGRQVKRSYQSYGFFVKLSAVVILGMCFVFVWSLFSNFSVTSQRETFDDIAEPVSSASKNTKVSDFQTHPNRIDPKKGQESDNKQSINSGLDERNKKITNGSTPLKPPKNPEKIIAKDVKNSDENSKLSKKNQENEGSEDNVNDDDGEGNDKESEDVDNSDADLINKEDLDEDIVDEDNSYRHHERSCPKSGLVCLVPLPRDGYEAPVQWPESKLKVFYKNVAHPKLASYMKSKDWLVESGEYITFPQNQSLFKGGIQHYLESIEEMVPDIEWGKNIRVSLDMGCKDSSFGASLLEKDVLTLTLGLKDDLVDLAQIALERGFPAVVSPFANRRLPFPSGVFDVIHCGECSVSWHSNGGKLILEMNRILRPGGYVPLKTCLHSIPESIEQRGTEWPAEWPKRLHTFPDWMNNRDKLIADNAHWQAIVNNSYLIGIGIDWSTIRNVMDMKAINGGFAAALSDKNVWAIVIVVEMDRLLRPGGWAIIRDKVEILNPLEEILRNLHWEIRMTFAQNREDPFSLVMNSMVRAYMKFVLVVLS